jgi:hypothetical protein
MPLAMQILDLALAHEIQINQAIKKKNWIVALKHIEAMKELIPNA